MIKKVIYLGTFDPITYGHIDVIKKALKIVDQVIVAISVCNDIYYLLEIVERMLSVVEHNITNVEKYINKIHFLVKNKPSNNLTKFKWQKKHEENLTGTIKAYKPEGSLSSDLRKNMKKYETWEF